jgi:hypothetical protein
VIRWAGVKVARLILAVTVLTAGAGCVHPVHEARPVRDLAGAGMNEPPAEARAAAWAWTRVAWSADGSRVAGGNKDGTVRVWDVATGREIGRTKGYVFGRDPHAGGQWDAGVMAFSPDGGRLAFAADDGHVCVWDIGTDRVTELVGQPRRVREVQFVPDGRTIVTASGGFTVSLPSTKWTTTRPATTIDPLTIIVFDTKTGRAVSRAEAKGFIAMTFTPDAERFVGLRMIGKQAGMAEVRRVADGALVRTLPATRLSGWLWPQFSPDGRWLLGGEQVWDTAAWRPVRDVGLEGRAFVDGGRRVLCIQHGQTGGWTPSDWLGGPSWVEFTYVDVRRGTTHDAGRWHGFGLESSMRESPSRISPDGRWLVDGMMRVWEVPR